MDVSYRFIAFEENNAAALVTGGQVIAGMVELDGGYYVGFGNVIYLTLVAEALCELPCGSSRFSFHHLSSLLLVNDGSDLVRSLVSDADRECESAIDW